MENLWKMRNLWKKVWEDYGKMWETHGKILYQWWYNSIMLVLDGFTWNTWERLGELPELHVGF